MNKKIKEIAAEYFAIDGYTMRNNPHFDIIFETAYKSISKELKEAKESNKKTVDSIYQILGKYGKDREDIKSDFRKLCELLNVNQKTWI
jgi:predicted S18 family serine protease